MMLRANGLKENQGLCSKAQPTNQPIHSSSSICFAFGKIVGARQVLCGSLALTANNVYTGFMQSINQSSLYIA